MLNLLSSDIYKSTEENDSNPVTEILAHVARILVLLVVKCSIFPVRWIYIIVSTLSLLSVLKDCYYLTYFQSLVSPVFVFSCFAAVSCDICVILFSWFPVYFVALFPSCVFSSLHIFSLVSSHSFDYTLMCSTCVCPMIPSSLHIYMCSSSVLYVSRSLYAVVHFLIITGFECWTDIGICLSLLTWFVWIRLLSFNHSLYEFCPIVK